MIPPFTRSVLGRSRTFSLPLRRRALYLLSHEDRLPGGSVRAGSVPSRQTGNSPRIAAAAAHLSHQSESNRSSPAYLRRQPSRVPLLEPSGRPANWALVASLEPETGIEPATARLQGECSAVELLRRWNPRADLNCRFSVRSGVPYPLDDEGKESWNPHRELNPASRFRKPWSEIRPWGRSE